MYSRGTQEDALETDVWSVVSVAGGDAQATSVRVGNSLWLVVAEPAFARPFEAGRRELVEQLERTSAVELIERGAEAARSLCLVELTSDGTAVIQGHAAPS